MAKAFDFTTTTEGADVLIDYGDEEGTYHVKVRVGDKIVESFENVNPLKLHKHVDGDHLDVKKAKAPRYKMKKGFHIAPVTEDATVLIDYGEEEGTYDIHVRVGAEVTDTYKGVDATDIASVLDSDHVEVERIKPPR